MGIFGGVGETCFDTACGGVVDGGGTDIALLCSTLAADEEDSSGSFRMVGLLDVASSDLVRGVGDA